MNYAPLWCKSNYSFLQGASHPDELVRRARDLGLPALALTDRDGVYGVVRAHVAARESTTKLIIGSEITVDSGERVVLLAKNRTGYAHLCELISHGRMRSEKGSSAVFWDEVCTACDGLIALLATGCERLDSDVLGELKSAYGADLAYIVSRHAEPSDPYRELDVRRQAERNRIPIVASTEVLYHRRSRKPLHDVCRCIAEGVTLHGAGSILTMNDEHALKSTDEIARVYSDIPAAVEYSAELAERCVFSLDELVYRYPAELLPDGVTSAQWLRRLTFEGARRRYPDAVPPALRRQIEKELALIEELDYGGYFLTMWDIVRFCRREGILCQGRGSAANSAVCYALGITAVDPVRMDLLFERFISRERAEPPDIDLDIEHRRREEVIRHMYEKYGRDRAAMVANVVRYRTRSAVREVGKVFGLPATSLDRLAKLISFRDADPEKAAADAGFSVSDAVMKRLIRFVKEIRDFPRHLSIHPGGFLLGSEPVYRLVPVENATMPGRTVVQWDKYDVEELGLFKVDLLGLGALTHLRLAFDLMRRHLDIDLSMERIPPKDETVFAMLEASDTVGVFQLESRAQMAMLPRLRPKSYYDIVIEISIVRPGPITGGMVHPYLRRRNGQDPVTYPHPSLEPVLAKTLGVPLFQEQVMKLAMVAAGYTPGDADQLRRDMAAWRREGTIERHHSRLVEGMRRRGIPEQFAEQVFQQIRGFGEYGFPESHAASFALIAYCTAWLKARFPVAFTCALLNAWPMGFYAPATIVEDARRHGIVMLPVDVVRSDWECRLVPLIGEDRVASLDRLKTRDAAFGIRMGLRFVRGIGREQFERLLIARRRKPRDLEEFKRYARLPEDVLVTLSQGGAFDDFVASRREAVWRSLDRREISAEDGQGELLFDRADAPVFLDLSAADRVSWDHASEGHSTRGHPIEPYRGELTAAALPAASEVKSRENGSWVQCAGLVICRQRPQTASGTLFLTLEDETGFINCILWADVFERNRKVVLTSPILAVSGKLQKEGNVAHVIVVRCWRPDLSNGNVSVKSRDFH